MRGALKTLCSYKVYGLIDLPYQANHEPVELLHLSHVNVRYACRKEINRIRN
jgi:hypothetical protein